jgi:uncharacterized protein (TIGR04255 family)
MAQDQQQKFPKLSKAPIILAILEIKFPAPSALKISDLRSLKGMLKDTYPHYLEVTNTEIKIEAAQDKTPVSIKNTGLAGFTFSSANKKHDFYLTLNSFNFKQHSQYESWNDFKSVALAAWEKCSELIDPVALSRVSIRYINNIEIPVAPNSHMPQQEFFKTFIANTGTVVNIKPISNYFLRYTHPAGADNILIHFAQELKIGLPDRYPFIVDIDVIYEKDNQATNLAMISNKLDELRDIKNQYFFDNLTDYTYNLIK